MAQKIRNFEDIFSGVKSDKRDGLVNFVRIYKRNMPKEGIRAFITKMAKENNSGFPNRLYNDMKDFTADEIVSQMEEQYLYRDYLSGEIWEADQSDQYDGIYNLTLYTLMANRVAKTYKKVLDDNKRMDKEKRQAYRKTYNYFMDRKSKGRGYLLSNLYLYKKLENDDDFLYGHIEDANAKDAFVIDLPGLGQISFHFGSQEKMDLELKEASEYIKIILDKKLELGQIDEDKYNNIINDMQEEGIFPEYEGRFYEYSSAIPLEYKDGEEFKKAREEFGIANKFPQDLSEEDIERISKNSEYNSREIYFFAVKSEFTKSQLINLAEHLKERDLQKKEQKKEIQVSEIGKSVFNSTTLEERRAAEQHEKNKNLNKGNVIEKEH